MRGKKKAVSGCSACGGAGMTSAEVMGQDPCLQCDPTGEKYRERGLRRAAERAAEQKKLACKAPPLNTSKEAVALRDAAIDYDREGQRRNRALLKAALKYAAAVNRTVGTDGF